MNGLDCDHFSWKCLLKITSIISIILSRWNSVPIFILLELFFYGLNQTPGPKFLAIGSSAHQLTPIRVLLNKCNNLLLEVVLEPMQVSTCGWNYLYNFWMFDLIFEISKVKLLNNSFLNNSHQNLKNIFS